MHLQLWRVIHKEIQSLSRAVFYLMNALVAARKAIDFCSCSPTVPQASGSKIKAAEQKPKESETPQSHRKTYTVIKGCKQSPTPKKTDKTFRITRGHCVHAVQQLSLISFRWLENSFCNPYFPFPPAVKYTGSHNDTEQKRRPQGEHGKAHVS